MTNRVLITEDDTLVRFALLMLFEDIGWNVREAVTGDEARQILQNEEPPELLLTDIRMPGGIDGWQLGEEARRIHPQLPIIYVSGFSEEKPRLVPGSRHLLKPCNAQIIFDAMSELGLPLSEDDA